MENRLTQISSGSGCGCKIHPAKLEEILREVKQEAGTYPDLLVGNHTADDASVYQINAESALIQTVDFFTPVVDDAYTFGQIAAANAISDVYAMGGRPLMANALLCWPVEKLLAEQAAQVLAGARNICQQAQIPMAGGHSVNLQEVAFGLSVTGLVHPAKLLKNSSAQAGDFIFLTKALGTGILSTAFKRGLLSEEGYRALVNSCTALNNFGMQLPEIKGIHALTDVTGFGFYGHLMEMCKAAQLSAEIHFNCIPRMAEAEAYAQQFVLPDNTFRNWNSYAELVKCDNAEAFAWLNDPQTNGGLLVAVAPAAREAYIAAASAAGLPEYACQPLGRFTSLQEHLVYIR